MIRILICDDEGIVQQSLKFMIEKGFGKECETESARNGRTAIEMAGSFRPDIVLMDIQMPGINGIEAMQRIRRENPNVLFIVLTAYDKFEYTQRSIDVGVMAYLTKPIARDTLTEAIRKAMKIIREKKETVSHNLMIQEKLETVIPIVENGFIYSLLIEGMDKDYMKYRELLSIEDNYGYVIVIECGDELHKGVLDNPVGAGISFQKQNVTFREIVKETINGIISNIMANKIIIVVPCPAGEESYDDRVMKIDIMRGMLRKIEQQMELKFKAGIGSVKKWKLMSESYHEAIEAINYGLGKVVHVKDISTNYTYEENYLYGLEKELLESISKGKPEQTKILSEDYFTFLKKSTPVPNEDVRIKILELVLLTEHAAGGETYRFGKRKRYLSAILSFKSYEEIEIWFLNKLTDASRNIMLKQQKKSESIVEKAKEYIEKNFFHELTLEETARAVGISPYYLSKLFKDSAGINYIDYVTKLRIECAKKGLKERQKSIKEVCYEAGYSEPNYFSRIFKKWVGVTPTEYREGRAIQ